MELQHHRGRFGGKGIMKTKDFIKLIDKEIEIYDLQAFKHCFKRGKMCDECWERKQPLIRLKEKLIGYPKGHKGKGIMKEKPYPAGHNWEGLTPSQVSEGYKKKEFDLSKCINKEIDLLEKNDDLLKVKFVKEFIKRDVELVKKLIMDEITWDEFIEERNELLGEDLTKDVQRK